MKTLTDNELDGVIAMLNDELLLDDDEISYYLKQDVPLLIAEIKTHRSKKEKKDKYDKIMNQNPKTSWQELRKEFEAKAKLKCVACGKVHKSTYCNRKEYLQSLGDYE